jgi:hypothetical protein
VKRFVVRIILILFAAFGLTGGGLRTFGQHVHLFCGAEKPQQDARLILVNRASYDTNSNGGITPECLYMAAGDSLYPGLFSSDATFVSLPATLPAGGPAPNCAAIGASIEAQMISVSGPEGGEISLWQENEDATATTKLFTLPAGTGDGTNRFNVTDPVAAPDPFGHIHGRRFTANKLGLYTVGFQLFDTSTNGMNGGPIHTPSITNYLYFQGGFCIDSIAKTNDTVTIRFGVFPFKSYDLEANTDLATTNWVKLDGFAGNSHSHLQFLTDSNATAPARFYRVRQVN